MKYNSIGEQLIAKAKELDPNYKPDKFNDLSEALDIILNNSGSNAFDLSPYVNPEEQTITIEGFEKLKDFMFKGGHNAFYNIEDQMVSNFILDTCMYDEMDNEWVIATHMSINGADEMTYQCWNYTSKGRMIVRVFIVQGTAAE